MHAYVQCKSILQIASPTDDAEDTPCAYHLHPWVGQHALYRPLRDVHVCQPPTMEPVRPDVQHGRCPQQVGPAVRLAD